MEQAEYQLSRTEAMLWVGKIALIFFLILGLIYASAVLSPRIAAWIDKKRGKTPEYTRYDEHTRVKGMFEADLPKDKNQKENEEQKDNGEG